MLIQLDPDRMAQLGITTSDVAAAVREQNATNPAGRLGREPAPPGTELTLPVTTLGRLKTPDQFADIVVRAKADGSIVRIRDIGKVVLGSRNYDLAGRLERHAGGADAAVSPRPAPTRWRPRRRWSSGWTSCRTASRRGVHYKIPFDTTPFVTASIKEVVNTLLEAMVLVTLVVFIFLQSWRATLIPMLAVPVSVIGTFLGLLVLGFTINVLTLFALVLAIGIVVDDAIVVIENIERIMANECLPARLAADQAIRQVAGALVAIVLVLCAVFVPVAFLGGVTGEMFKQFAVTIVIAVVLSGHGGADAHACALRAAAQGVATRTHTTRLLRLVQPEVRTASPTVTSTAWAGCWAGRGVAGGVRGDGGAGGHALEAGADRVHSHRGQGLLRHRDAAARRVVAAADQGGGPAGRGIPP